MLWREGEPLEAQFEFKLDFRPPSTGPEKKRPAVSI